MLPIAPVFSKFPFIGVHSLVEIYAIFRFEPVHMLLLGSSKLVKEWSVLYLSDLSRVSSAIRYRYSQPKTFCVICRTVIKPLNEFIENNRRKFNAQWLTARLFEREKWRKTYWGVYRNRFFRNAWKKRLWKHRSCVTVFWRCVDVCCRNSKDAPVTDIFTQYVDLIQTIR